MSGIKISKPGSDVNTCPDNELIFNSNYPLLKVHKRGYSKIVTDGSDSIEVEIPHDVGLIPMYFVRGQMYDDASITVSDKLYQYPKSVYHGVGANSYFKVIPYRNKIVIRFDFVGHTPSAGDVFNFDYIIYEDPIVDPSINLIDFSNFQNKIKNDVDPGILNVLNDQFGLFISKPGKSVYSKNIDDFIFRSDGPTFHVKKRLKMNVTTSAIDPGIQIEKFRHGFGYTPQVIAFVTTEPSRALLSETFINVPSLWEDTDGSTTRRYVEVFDCYADDQNVYIEATNYNFEPMGAITYRSYPYTFDLLLSMEEAK